MASRQPTREELIRQDIQGRHRPDYATPLFREAGGLSNFVLDEQALRRLEGAIGEQQSAVAAG
jgi:hypothetical protein